MTTDAPAPCLCRACIAIGRCRELAALDDGQAVPLIVALFPCTPLATLREAGALTLEGGWSMRVVRRAET